MLAAVGVAAVNADQAYLRALQSTFNRCAVEQDFDFQGMDLTSKPDTTGGTLCCDYCHKNSRCAAWTWSNYNGGTCWLKTGRGKVVYKPGAKSAVYTSGFLCSLEPDTDYVGNDLGSQASKVPQDCCGICKNTAKCRAYTWSDYNGGTCYLKSGVGQVVSKPGVQAGTVYPDPPIWYSLQKDVEFVDNDLASAPSKDANGCALICQNTPDCRAFSWSDYNGGTCWLKNSLTQVKAKTGVISSVVLSRSPSCTLFKDTDIVGEVIANVSSPTLTPTDTSCCALCLANPSCRVFTWNNWRGGTCYFKAALGRQRRIVAPPTASGSVLSLF